MRRFLRENGLSLTMFGLFFLFLAGQSVTGFQSYNQEQQEHKESQVGYVEYLSTGHFVEAVFENWESEFLQMGLYVLLTAFLFQKGSAESKDPDGSDPVDEDPRGARGRQGVPGPVGRGGPALRLYEHSLTTALLGLFLLSIVLHAVGGLMQYNEEQLDHGERAVSLLGFVSKHLLISKASFW